MNINKNLLYIFGVLFSVFIIFKLGYMINFAEINPVSFKSLSIMRAFFPLGIIKQCALYDTNLPLYYLIGAFFRFGFLVKILNTIISFLCVIMMFFVGKKIKNIKFGLFLALILCVNHFFLYYTSLICPFCLSLLIKLTAIYFLYDFIKFQSKKTFVPLAFSNALMIFTDTFGFIYVLAQLFVLYFINGKNQQNKKMTRYTKKLFYSSLISFVVVFPILIIQYVRNLNYIIPNNYDSIALNFSSFYLLISEYITPYLSFSAPDFQTKSLIGIIYSFFLNSDITNINTVKILCIIFFTSFVPIILFAFYLIKTLIKNNFLRTLILISSIDFCVFLILFLKQSLPVEPIYTIDFYILFLIILCYGIFSIKNKNLKISMILFLFLIQILSPNINSFDISINKSDAVLNPINVFFKKNKFTKKDLIIMPYMGHFAKLYWGKYRFLDFDYDYLKNKILSSNDKITNNNARMMTSDYLNETKINDYLLDKINNELNLKTPQRLVIIIDKQNSKPISRKSVAKCASWQNYSKYARTINFKKADLSSNQSKILFDALKSKTLYNIIAAVNFKYKLNSIVGYKKIENKYYDVLFEDNVAKAISSPDNDYLFLIFERREK